MRCEEGGGNPVPSRRDLDVIQAKTEKHIKLWCKDEKDRNRPKPVKFKVMTQLMLEAANKHGRGLLFCEKGIMYRSTAARCTGGTWTRAGSNAEQDGARRACVSGLRRIITVCEEIPAGDKTARRMPHREMRAKRLLIAMRLSHRNLRHPAEYLR
jgi:hypothetical protein